jgi:transposase
MSFIRKIKKGNAVYLAKVETYREEGKVKQRVLEYVGKEENGVAVQKVDINKVSVDNVRRYADVTVLYQLSKELRLQYLLGKEHKAIIALLIAHLLCKGSVTRIFRWMEQTTIRETLGIAELSTEKLYQALDALEDCDFTKVEQSLYEQWISLAPDDNKSFVLDVTDTYYSGKGVGEQCRKGKDGKVSKLVQIGLGVSFENGFPIFHERYGGNISNIKILEDLMYKMAERGIDTIVMDRGFYSEANITALHQLKMKMIAGVKQSAGIKKTLLSTINREALYTAKHQVALKNTYVYVQEFPFLFGKMIVLYNPKQEALKRDKMLADGATQAAVKYVGYSLIFHTTELNPATVVQKYFDKDIVERSFRTMKGEVQLHPVRLWMPRRVKAHVKICYLSLCLLALIKFKCRKLALSPATVLQELETIYKVQLKHSVTGQSFDKVVTLTNQQKNILKALNCSV